MNDLFDKNAHRLGDEEREDLWRRVSGALPTPSAAAAAVNVPPSARATIARR